MNRASKYWKRKGDCQIMSLQRSAAAAMRSGYFIRSLKMTAVRLIGVEAAGRGVDTDEHAATMTKGRHGVFQGSMSYVLQDEDGQVLPAHSISAGLDYPGIGPEHAYLKDAGRAEYFPITDEEALDALQLLSPHRRHHSGAGSRACDRATVKLAPTLIADQMIVVSLSGRGDKDVEAIMSNLEEAQSMNLIDTGICRAT